MSRLLFPEDPAVDRVQATPGTALLSAAGATARVYVDAAGTQLADILNADATVNPTATLTLDNQSRLPAFYGPVSGVDVLYVRVDGGGPIAVYATVDARLDAGLSDWQTELDAALAAHDAAVAAQLADNVADVTALLSSKLDVVARSAVNAGPYVAGAADPTAGLQAAIDDAFTLGLPCFIPPITTAADYALTDHLMVRSQHLVFGIPGKTILRQTTPGKAVMVSRNWVAGQAGAAGKMVLHGLSFRGEPTNTASHGLIFRDYLSTLSQLSFSACGGNGLHMTTLNSTGAPYGGSSLVDNRFVDLDARDNAGYGLFLGELDNQKFTDAYMDRVYVDAGAGAPGAIYCGTAAGWHWGKVHTYGAQTAIAIEVQNTNNTQLDSLYTESGMVNVQIGRVQRNTVIGSLKAKVYSDGGVALKVASRSTLVAATVINVGQLALSHDDDLDCSAVDLSTSTIKVHVGTMTRDGLYPARIAPASGTAATSVLFNLDTRTSIRVRDSQAGRTLTVGGQDVPVALSPRTSWSGSGAQVVAVGLPDLGEYHVMNGTLSIGSVRNFNGAIACRWRADLIVTSKDAADAWSVYVADLLPPSGFDVAPTVTVDKATRTLTVSFTPTATDSSGVVSATLATV